MSICALVGNIGSGKSKILDHLKKTAPIYAKNVEVIETPAQNCIKEFYENKDSETTVVRTQIAFIQDYLNIYAKIDANPGKIFIMEKSMEEIINVFLPILNCPAALVELFNVVYDKSFGTIQDKKYIQIESKPETCYSSLSDEKKKVITEKYLQDLAVVYNSLEFPISLKIDNGTRPQHAATKILEFVTGKKIGYVPQTYVIIGNIAVGKSLVLDKIGNLTPYKKDEYKFHIFPENVVEWEPYLKKFYASPSKNWYKLQKVILAHYEHVQLEIEKICKGKSHRTDAKTPTYIIVERSPRDIFEIFIKPMKGKVPKKEYKNIEYDYEKLCAEYIWQNTKTILLTATPETCMHRCTERKRNSETKVDEAYLGRINNLHNHISANYVIDTNSMQPSDVAYKIREIILND